MMEIREKESPARTIDSTGSTAASMETIVDLNSTYNNNEDKIQTQQAAMENSTNTTNYNKNSLTNSQISMISSNEQKTCNNFNNNNNNMDPQHHIYTSPDLVLGGQKNDKKFSVKKFKEELVPIKSSSSDNDLNNKKKLEILKSKGKSLDLISTKSSVSQKSTKKPQQSFPIYIILGILQLVLSISLVALGCLLIIREAALSTIGSGIWSGGIAAIAGALGVINLSKSRAGFLAVSLICVASSTLAIALTGTGLVRDISRWDQNQEFNILNTEAAVSAGCGLIFALGLHLIISIISVYKSAIKLCSRNPNEGNKQMLENIITVTNSSMGLNQQKLEEYINSMSASEKEKMLLPENIDKLMAMWMYSSKRPQQRPPQPKRPIVLVPATAGNGLQMLPPGCRTPHGIIIPPPAVIPPYSMHPPPAVGRLPPPPPGSIIFPDGSCRISRPASEIANRYHYPPNKQKRSGKNAANNRQRRKSDTDAENQKAFIYTGLDRSIADSFLERQEQSNGSHIDYSSSNESYRSGRKCPDVAM